MKTRSQTTPKKATDAELKKLAAMADKPYEGSQGAVEEKEQLTRCSVTLFKSQTDAITNLVRQNIYEQSGPKSTSEVCREALAMYLASLQK